MKAFEVDVDGRRLDYRVGHELDLVDVQKFFEDKYNVLDLRQGGRHVVGTLERDGQELFVKLSTSEGISHLTKDEYEWNEQFNREVPRSASRFWVPQNYDSGFYAEKLYYLITDRFSGSLLAERPEKSSPQSLKEALPDIIGFSELIQELPISITGRNENHQEFFRAKANAWYQAIPEEVRDSHEVSQLLTVVDESYQQLQQKTRHGDFTPWHLMRLEGDKLGLIDGEHAMGTGVEYYDIAYFIQRVYSVLEDPALGKDIVKQVLGKGYNQRNLQTVLAARGIGGYLDESLKPQPDYTLQNSYQDFVLSL